jgi:hypothetical protein
MNGTGYHNAIQNKSGAERQVVHDLIHMRTLQKYIIQNFRTEWWFPEPGAGQIGRRGR